MNLGEKSNPRRQIITVLIALTLTLSLFFTAHAAEPDQIVMYVSPETEHLSVADLISQILETRLGVTVTEKVEYPNICLRKVASGTGDLYIGLSTPVQRDVSWQYSVYDFCDLGPLYGDVVSGLGVPNYVPKDKLGTIMDLTNTEVKERLHWEIIGYERERLLLEKSNQLLDRIKGLEGYKILGLDEIAANSELSRAIANEEWIVVFLKRPSVPYSIYDTRFLAELTFEQTVHALAKTDFMGRYPDDVTQFLSRMYLPIDLVNELIKLYDENKRTAARKFIEAHPDLVDYWLEGTASLE